MRAQRTDTRRVVIVGGGIAGLAAAYRLRQLSKDIEVVLVERETRLGGKILTERLDGFVIEGGPDSFLSSKRGGIELCRELGLFDRLQGPDEQRRRTYVMRNGDLHRMPEGLTGLVPSRLGPLLRSSLITPAGKLRAALDLAIPARREDRDETLAAFVERRLGRELYERLVEPLMAGIYAGDGEELSLAATFPQLRRAEREHGSLIRGIGLTRKQSVPGAGSGQPLPAFLTPAGGMSELIEALETRLSDVRLLRATDAVGIAGGPCTYTVSLRGREAIQASAVILTTPAFATADLVAGLDGALADLLWAIPYASTATVSLAYPLADIPRQLDGYGYIVPRREGRPILACTWTSSKFPQRAPPGYALIRAFLGRAGADGIVAASDEEPLAAVRAELSEVLGVTTEPLLCRIYRWPKAMPQYVQGHLQRLADIDDRLAAHPGLFLAGSSYRGVGIPDCIQSGETAAAGAIDLLQARTGGAAGGALHGSSRTPPR